MGDTEEVAIDIAVPPETVYDMVSDLPRMGEWSPECERCEWVGSATAAATGARFKGHNRNGKRTWSTDGRIVIADPGRELAFEITSVGLKVARWGYRIEPTPTGCHVTEYTQDQRGAIIRFLARTATGVSDRPARNRMGMQATLDRLKIEAERPSPG